MRAYSLKEIYEGLLYGSEHGYSLFPEIKTKDVRISKNPAITALCNEISAAAEKAAAENMQPLSFSEFSEFERNGIRHNYENHYRENLQRLTAFVLSDYINRENKYLKETENYLWQWLNEYTWEYPAHIALRPENVCFLRKEGDVATGLFSTAMAVILSEILMIIRDKLHPMITARVKKEIEKRILKPYMENLQFWEGGGYNWAAVCGGAVGMTAIYSDMDYADLSFVISRVIAAFASYFETLESDGSCREGLGYWGYGFSYFTFFACLLKERTCGKINLFDDSFVKKSACFPLVMQFPDGYTVNFADTPSNKYYGGLGFFTRLSELTGANCKLPDSVPLAGWLAVTRDLYWGAESIKKYDVLTGDFRYEKSRIFVSRGYTKYGDFYAFSAKGGHNAEPHNHNDVGQFLINIENCPVIIDLGSPLYTKETFEDETRYKILQCSSESHNVPEIDGKYQMHGKEYCAKNVTFGKGTLSMDIASAYPGGTAESVIRCFDFDAENAYAVVTDKFIFKSGSHEICERFAISKKPKISGNTVSIDCGKYNFEIFSKFPGASVKAVQREYTDNAGGKNSCYFIEFYYTGIQNTFECEIHIQGKLKAEVKNDFQGK